MCKVFFLCKMLFNEGILFKLFLCNCYIFVKGFECLLMLPILKADLFQIWSYNSKLWIVFYVNDFFMNLHNLWHRINIRWYHMILYSVLFYLILPQMLIEVHGVLVAMKWVLNLSTLMIRRSLIRTQHDYQKFLCCSFLVGVYLTAVFLQQKCQVVVFS